MLDKEFLLIVVNYFGKLLFISHNVSPSHVQGVPKQGVTLSKAREHFLLRSERPSVVTILSLVRDAASRLPNGEGTRAEVNLLASSFF